MIAPLNEIVGLPPESTPAELDEALDSTGLRFDRALLSEAEGLNVNGSHLSSIFLARCVLCVSVFSVLKAAS